MSKRIMIVDDSNVIRNRISRGSGTMDALDRAVGDWLDSLTD